MEKKMKKTFIIILITLMVVGCERHTKSIEIGFWNVENLFDLEDDPLKNDDEFSLDGRKMITQEILNMKLDHMSEVISLT